MPRRSSDSRTPFDPPDYDAFADAPSLRSGTRTAKRPSANRLNDPDVLDVPSVVVPPGRASRASSGTAASTAASGALRRRLTGEDNASSPRATQTSRSGKSYTASRKATDDTLSLFEVAPDGRATRRRKGSVAPPLSRRGMWREIAGVFCIALGLVLLLNVLQRDKGSLMARAREGLEVVLGIGAYAVPFALVVLGTLLVVGRGRANLHAFARGLIAAFAVGLTWVHLSVRHGAEFADMGAMASHGGVFGASLSWALRSVFGESGVRVVLVAASVVCLLLWTELSLNTLVGRGIQFAQRAWDYVATPHAPSASSSSYAAVAEETSTSRPSRKSVLPALPSLTSAFSHETDEDNYEEDPSLDVDDDATSWMSSAPVPVAAPSAPLRSASMRGARSASSARTPLPPLPAEDELDDIESEVELHSARQNAAERVLDISDLEQAPLNPIQALRKGTSSKKSPSLTTAGATTPAASVDATASVETAPVVAPVATGSSIVAPRVEIANVTPPPSVLDLPPDEIPPGDPLVASELLSAGDDEIYTPAELLEAQAQASASETSVTSGALKATRACRSFGTSVMPPYFDEAVRAFDAPIPADVSGVEDDVAEGVAAVQETLGAFKVDARVTDVKRGPVITRYEVQPAPGVRVAAIANLDKDLARSLSALAVRIEAPVPGKNVVGIEVPNKRVHLVRLRDVLELPEFLGAPSKLSFVLGRDIAGQPKWADLTKMPHLLIAGATNSGKSVCLNSIIASILCRATPEEVKFSLIDPKRVELTLFRDIKHLYHPVVVEPKDAVRALRGAIAEMDRRYRKFAARGVRNIASYNSKLDPEEQPLPYLVIVIDELADLMMTAAAEFEKLICRLAQLARATGIHLIVATQRPSVNVITGVIKANIPARIAFAVASQVDSRTILDSVGAERLIGSGDMLFDANNGGKALRIQGAYLSEEEVNRLVESVKASYQYDDKPLDYGMDLNLVAEDESFGGGSSDEPTEKRDDLYDDIREFVIRHQEMSASMIQRKFEIGYPRAGRIVDQLERDGVLGPADGPKARKVLGGG